MVRSTLVEILGPQSQMSFRARVKSATILTAGQLWAAEVVRPFVARVFSLGALTAGQSILVTNTLSVPHNFTHFDPARVLRNIMESELK